MIRKLNQLDQSDRVPYQRPNDDWVDVVVQLSEQADRAHAVVRRRSLRSRRKIFTLSITAFTMGALMIVMSSPFRNDFIAPGELSSPHAQILAADGSDRCAACHEAAEQSFGGWVSSMFFGHSKQTLSQSQRCMKCHEKTLTPELALKPHNVSVDVMTAKTEQAALFRQASIRRGTLSPPLHEGDIKCNACHREHHGKDRDLAAMTDSQCQTCHQSSFSAFEVDHPELKNYPLKRRSRIAFDHTSHSLKHFPEAAATFNCNQCHVDDDYQNVKKLTTYEQACAQCHDKQIDERSESGLALLALPMLDMRAIEASGKQVGGWPMAATGDFDGPFPPLMRALLASDHQLQPILKRLPEEFDFADLDPSNPKDVQDAVTIVAGIKRLLYDLAVNGNLAIGRRLEMVGTQSVSPLQLSQLAETLNESVFRNAIRRWLPSLPDEIQRAQKAMGKPAEPENAGQGVDRSESADQLRFLPKPTWTLREREMLARISARIEGRPELPSEAAGSLKQRPQDKQRLVENPLKSLMSGKANQRKRLPKNTKRVNKTNVPRPPKQDPVGEQLVPNPLQRLPGKKPITILPPKKLDLTEHPKTLPPADNLEVHGWVRDDQLFQIRYRPAGHADPSLKAWIDLVAQTPDGDNALAIKPLFNRLVAANSLGDCRRCHTADQQFESKTVNWKSVYRDPAIRSFTKFSHGPHLVQAGLRECAQCHDLDSTSGNHESFVGYDPMKFSSNFAPIKIANCAQCHQKGSTNSSCTQCHNYHIGSQIISR